MSEAPQEEAAKSRAASPPSSEVAPPLLSNAKGMYTYFTYQLYANVNSAYIPLHGACCCHIIMGLFKTRSTFVRSALAPGT